MEEEINYCLNCKNKPCATNGCPLGNDIPAFIQAVKENEIKKAYTILSKTTVLPGVCGRICPHLKQCEGSCVRGIKGKPVNIGKIEAYIFDLAMENKIELKDIINKKEKGTKKVAVVGGGPVGLTCAAFLAKEGVSVTIYEKNTYLGGLLMHGIPEFRLPRKIVEKTIEEILKLGINVEYNKALEDDLNLQKLEKKYDAIFLSVGANKSNKLGVEGENLQGVYGGNELLEKNNHPAYEGKKVAIIGGGNVAIDCARTIKRKGAKDVVIIYRRNRKQMPAEEKELIEAENEGIEFLFNYNIIKITGKEKVEKVELIKTKTEKKYIEEENNSNKICEERVVNIENSNVEMACDYVVKAIGAGAEEYLKSLGIELDKKGKIKVGDNFQTSKNKIYAGGNVVGAKETVAWASRTGREAAKNIIKNI